MITGAMLPTTTSLPLDGVLEPTDWIMCQDQNSELEKAAENQASFQSLLNAGFLGLAPSGLVNLQENSFNQKEALSRSASLAFPEKMPLEEGSFTDSPSRSTRLMDSPLKHSEPSLSLSVTDLQTQWSDLLKKYNIDPKQVEVALNLNFQDLSFSKEVDKARELQLNKNEALNREFKLEDFSNIPFLERSKESLDEPKAPVGRLPFSSQSHLEDLLEVQSFSNSDLFSLSNLGEKEKQNTLAPALKLKPTKWNEQNLGEQYRITSAPFLNQSFHAMPSQYAFEQSEESNALSSSLKKGPHSSLNNLMDLEFKEKSALGETATLPTVLNISAVNPFLTSPDPSLNGLTSQPKATGWKLSPEQVEQLGSKISQAQIKGGVFKVKLNPEHLGELHLEIQSRGNQVHLKVKSSKGLAEKVLSSHLSELKETLSRNDLQLQGVEFLKLDRPEFDSQSFAFSQESFGNSQQHQTSSGFDEAYGQGQREVSLTETESFKKANPKVVSPSYLRLGALSDSQKKVDLRV